MLIFFRKLLKSFVDGARDGSFISFGHLGSGKTSSLFGKLKQNKNTTKLGDEIEKIGIIQKFLNEYFQEIEKRKSDNKYRGVTFETFVSFFELKDGKLVDILSHTKKSLEIYEHESVGLF